MTVSITSLPIAAVPASHLGQETLVSQEWAARDSECIGPLKGGFECLGGVHFMGVL